MKNRATALAAVLACSCGGGALSVDGLAPESEILPPGCEGKAPPATTLLCTGLYLDIVTKELAPGVEHFTPAVALWSDGADKNRWIRLPPGTVIDNSDPNEWVFPVGTKLWKQFAKDGRLVETRLWQKVRDRFWVDAAYAWNADETAAVQTGGGDIPFGNGIYHIPKQDECEKCHRGHNEHILGFEQVELGLAGSTGMTLSRLVAEGRLSNPPASADPLTIGDDGTGAAAPALGWLHANCGITCHNANPNSTGYGAGMDLRMDPRRLDGQSVAGFDSLRTTVGVTVNTPAWTNRTRIVPGDPTTSLLYELISNRGMGRQMPPIATNEVDVQHVALVAEWIRRMPPGPGGGPDPTVVDAGMPVPIKPDAATPDVAVVPPDAYIPDPPPPDAAVPDAPPPEPDASVPEPDASVPEPDAGVPEPDAGVPEPDAALDPDAGQPPDAPPADTEPDAGTPDADETATPPDAGPDDLATAL